MADNVEADAGSGGATFATDDVSGVHYPISKLAFGALDTANLVTSTGTNPLPVALSDTDNAVLDAIQTAVELIDNAISGTEMQVDIVAPLPAGTNAIGKLAANSGVDIGDVDVTSFPSTVHSADFDTGGGTDTTLAFGIAVPASGGAAVVPGDATAGLKVDLGADNDVTVTGTVDLGATDNAVLDAIAASLAILDDWDETDRAKVNLIVGQAGIAAGAGAVGATVPRVTLASDDPAVALLGTIDSDTSTLAGAVSGTEMQVDVVAALPAGTNAIGKLAANSGVDIGDVDILSVIPGTGATNLGKAEDAAHTTGDTGVMALAVRQDSDASFAGTSGDYAPLQLDDNGFLKVNIKAGAGSGGTASTDDGAFTAGSGSGTPAMGFFSTDTVDAGDVGVLAMDASRRLLVSIEADNVGIGGGTQYTEDDAVPANPVGNALLAERDDALGGLTPAEGDWTNLFCDANGALWVKPSGTVTVDGSGVTQPISAASLPLPTGAATEATLDAVKTALQLIDDPVFADDAAFTAGTSKVFAIGAIADETSPDSVDEGDVGIPRMTLDRQLRVTLGSNAVQGVSIFRSIDLDESEEDVKTSAGNLYGYYFSNSNASARFLKFYNATAATVVVGTTTPVLTLYLPPTSAGHIAFPVPVFFSTAICVAATTGVADNDTGAPGANEVVLNVFYK